MLFAETTQEVAVKRTVVTCDDDEGLVPGRRLRALNETVDYEVRFALYAESSPYFFPYRVDSLRV